MFKHTLVKFKHLACGLHFTVHTWQPEKHTAAAVTCPECGKKDGKFVVWREDVDRAVFEDVPGKAGLAEIRE